MTLKEKEILDCIESRRSVRRYKPDAIPQETLEKIVEAGLYAPTGMNRQSPIIVVVTDRDLRDRLSRMNASEIGRASCRERVLTWV